jgi:ADP-ribose pyrophosphatase YjhB (NUDIX family)
MYPRGQVVKAMVVIRRPRDGAMLVSEHTDPALSPFHRPLGGHVEYGEYAIATARRELAEEIGQDLTDMRLLGVLENIFEWEGTVAHEIVFIFRAEFADESAYEIEEQFIRDEPGTNRVIWRPAGAASPPLYPDGLTELLAADAPRASVPRR